MIRGAARAPLFLLALLAFLGLLAPEDCRAMRLKVLYFERPPYYTLVEGVPGGVLLNMARTILEAAGIEPEFQEMPAKRIIETIKTSREPVCSVGWFKTEERQRFARFSQPFYQDLPLAAVFLRSGRQPPPGVDTLAALTASPGLTLGLNAAFSYGEAVDAAIASPAQPPVRMNGTQMQLMRMLAAKRFDYALFNPEETDTLACLAGIDPAELFPLALKDIPKGNLRYMMFSLATREDVVRRVNAAIQRLVKPEDAQ